MSSDAMLTPMDRDPLLTPQVVAITSASGVLALIRAAQRCPTLLGLSEPAPTPIQAAPDEPWRDPAAARRARRLARRQRGLGAILRGL